MEDFHPPPETRSLACQNLRSPLSPSLDGEESWRSGKQTVIHSFNSGGTGCLVRARHSPRCQVTAGNKQKTGPCKLGSGRLHAQGPHPAPSPEAALSGGPVLLGLTIREGSNLTCERPPRGAPGAGMSPRAGLSPSSGMSCRSCASRARSTEHKKSCRPSAGRSGAAAFLSDPEVQRAPLLRVTSHVSQAIQSWKGSQHNAGERL